MQTVQPDGSEAFVDERGPDALWAVEYVESLGVETVQVFASYVLGHVSEVAFARLREANVHVEFEPPPLISIGNYRFNPCGGEPDLPADLRITTVDPDERAYFLVQIPWGLNQTSRAEWRSLSREVTVIRPVSDETSLVQGEGRHLEILEEMSFVSDVSFYHPAYKISPGVSTNPLHFMDLEVTLHTAERPLQVAEQVQSAGGWIIEADGLLLRVKATGAAVPGLARISSVYRLDLWQPSFPSNPWAEPSMLGRLIALALGIGLVIAWIRVNPFSRTTEVSGQNPNEFPTHAHMRHPNHGETVPASFQHSR